MGQTVNQEFYLTLYIIYVKQCGKNGQNFPCNTASFFTMTMLPCTQYSLSIGFSRKTKLLWFHSQNLPLILLQQTFFPLSKMKSEFNKMQIGFR